MKYIVSTLAEGAASIHREYLSKGYLAWRLDDCWRGFLVPWSCSLCDEIAPAQLTGSLLTREVRIQQLVRLTPAFSSVFHLRCIYTWAHWRVMSRRCSPKFNISASSRWAASRRTAMSNLQTDLERTTSKAWRLGIETLHLSSSD